MKISGILELLNINVGTLEIGLGSYTAITALVQVVVKTL
jgi:hypothetical protein